MDGPITASSAETTSPGSDRVRELQRQIGELKKSWPAHSTPPAMLLLLEEMEEELEKEKRSQV
jgi:hypothetical protein